MGAGFSGGCGGQVICKGVNTPGTFSGQSKWQVWKIPQTFREMRMPKAEGTSENSSQDFDLFHGGFQ